MPRKCTVCHHPDRLEIDRALLAGRPLSSLASQYHLSASALSRHHRHLQDRLTGYIAILEQQREQEALSQLATLIRLVVNAAEVFAHGGEQAQVLKSAREAAGLVKLMRTFKSPWSPLAAYNLLLSPEYVADGTIVTTNPLFYAAQRRLVAENFSASCEDLAQPAKPVADTSTSATFPDPEPPKEASSHGPQPSQANGTVSADNGIYRDGHHHSGAPLSGSEPIFSLLAHLLPGDLPPLREEHDPAPLPLRYRLRNPQGTPLYMLDSTLNPDPLPGGGLQP